MDITKCLYTAKYLKYLGFSDSFINVESGIPEPQDIISCSEFG
jgi:hypothetical protein